MTAQQIRTKCRLLAATFWGLCVIPLGAQITFPVADLPNEIGSYYRAYAGAGVDVSMLIGSSGGPQQWDFSQAQGANETVRRIDIVAPADSEDSAAFPHATYAERVTHESDGSRSWSFYRATPGVGRAYYGLVDANANPAKPVTVFTAPTIDLPDPIQFGQEWNRTVDWLDLIDLGFIQLQTAVHFISEARVDAYGTVILPGIGEVPALRVNEVNTYQVTDLTLGFPIEDQHFRNYYWLVPGIGKAVHIISPGSTSVPPENLTTAGTLLRVFEAGALQSPPDPRSVTGLRIRLDDEFVVIEWDPELDAAGYLVERLRRLGAEEWELAAEPVGSSWSMSLPLSEPQSFFRVWTKPQLGEE